MFWEMKISNPILRSPLS